MRDAMAQGPDPETVIKELKKAKTLPPLICVEVVDCFVRHEIVVPLLDMRLHHGDQVFRDPLTYFKRFTDFPRPLMLMQVGNKTRSIDHKSDGLLILWSMDCFLVDAIAQIVDGETVVQCPRKWSPLFRGMNLAFDGDFDNFLQRSVCGYWRKNLSTPLPNCLFREIINAIGFGARRKT